MRAGAQVRTAAVLAIFAGIAAPIEAESAEPPHVRAGDGSLNLGNGSDAGPRQPPETGSPDKRYGGKGRGRPGFRYSPRRHRGDTVVIVPPYAYHYRPYFWGAAPFRWDDRYGGYDYSRYYRPGAGYYGPVDDEGWGVLNPWLREEPAARHWVMWQFDSDRDGGLDEREAGRANRAFERLADRNRDGRLSDQEAGRAVSELRDEYQHAFR